jgi:hypothetical protein
MTFKLFNFSTYQKKGERPEVLSEELAGIEKDGSPMVNIEDDDSNYDEINVICFRRSLTRLKTNYTSDLSKISVNH